MSKHLDEALEVMQSDLPILKQFERLEALAEQAPDSEQDDFGDLLSSPPFIDLALAKALKN